LAFPRTHEDIQYSAFPSLTSDSFKFHFVGQRKYLNMIILIIFTKVDFFIPEHVRASKQMITMATQREIFACSYRKKILRAPG